MFCADQVPEVIGYNGKTITFSKKKLVRYYMLKEAIFHQVNSSYSYPYKKNQLYLRLRTKKDDVSTVKVHYLDYYVQKKHKIGENYQSIMNKIASDDLFDYYEAIINTHDLISVYYLFEINSEKEQLYYGDYKFYTNADVKLDSPLFEVNYVNEKDIFLIPEWAKDAIVYSIMPDRFNNGDSSLTPENVKSWNSKVEYNEYIGGDIIGITKKLDYLADLGINTIYLTPVFESNTVHKYKTIDYYKIDPNFGTLEDFKELVKQAHAKNIRIILDAVFNHCSDQFFAFQDVMNNGESSQYLDWFDIKSFPLEMETRTPNYKTYGSYWDMPKLMTKNDKVAKYCLEVAEYWMKETNIDGWRIDAAGQVDHSFWKDFRKVVKKVKPDALIIGELWCDANAYLQGDQFDTVMNYSFLFAIKEFVRDKKIDAKEFCQKVSEPLRFYKKEPRDIMLNFLASHDIERFRKNDSICIEQQKLALVILMTYIGIPMVYYGDETGLTGESRYSRLGMLWKEDLVHHDLLNFYKKMISIRKNYKPLTRGDFEILVAEESVLVFRREFQNEIIDIYINVSSTEQNIEIKKNGIARELIRNEEINIEEKKLLLAENSAIILYYKSKE